MRKFDFKQYLKVTPQQILAAHYNFGDMNGFYRNRRCLFINEATERQMGYPPKEFIGELFEKFIHPKDVERAVKVYKECETVAFSDHSEPVIFRFLAKSGKIILFQLKIVSLKDVEGMDDSADPNPLLKISFQDITHLQNYVRTMGHELKNQLVPVKQIQAINADTISQFRQCIAIAGLTDEIREEFIGYLNTLETWAKFSHAKVTAGLKRCNREMTQLLNAGPKYTPIKLFNELEELIEHRKSEAQILDIAFHSSELPQIEGLYLLTDIQLLYSVLDNLLGNATRAAASIDNPAKKHFYFDVRQEDDRPGKILLHFTVADEGRGFCNREGEPLKLTRAPYERVAPDVKTIQNGIGLIYSAKIVRQMGGELLVTNGFRESDKGNLRTVVEFSLWFDVFTLPRSPNRQIAASSLTLNPNSQIAESPLEILLVEDQAINAKMFVQSLRDYQCNFTLVPNGERAVKLCEERNFDLILMDFTLGGITGPAAAEMILKTNPASINRKTLILGMTATLDDQMQEGIDAGMREVLKKGESNKTIVDTINRLLETRQLVEKPDHLMNSQSHSKRKTSAELRINVQGNNPNQIPGAVNFETTPSSSDSSCISPAANQNPLSNKGAVASILSLLALPRTPAKAKEGVDFIAIPPRPPTLLIPVRKEAKFTQTEGNGVNQLGPAAIVPALIETSSESNWTTDQNPSSATPRPSLKQEKPVSLTPQDANGGAKTKELSSGVSQAKGKKDQSDQVKEESGGISTCSGCIIS